MNKNDIIKKWSYVSNNIHNKIHDLLVEKLINFYSDFNNVSLINLNLLQETFNHYYWYMCNTTGELYFINIKIDDRDYQLTKDIKQILSEVNKYQFKQINFEIDSIFNDNTTYLTQQVVNENKYGITNLSVEDKSINNLNKSSRQIRYQRKEILSASKKRKLNDDDDEEVVDWDSMISATSIRNYMLNDPLLDFLKEYNINSLDAEPTRIKFSNKLPYNRCNNFNMFTNCIMKAGIEFEDELIKIIKNKHKVVKVADSYIHSRCNDKFIETINYMKKGVPIIYQGVLHDYNNKTYGLPDLLVRSDYINKLMGYNVIDDNESKIGSVKLNLKYHYKVVDIKHSTIPLRADGTHILNSDSIPAYKGQLCIYTNILNNILGVDVKKAYIWGKKYEYETKNVKYEITEFLNKLAIIDYDNIDSEYVKQTNDAIEWIHTLRNEGSNWKLLDIPCRRELFPNMKNEKDAPYRQLKNELNEKICEITSVWNCGIKRREIAHSHGVYGWNNIKCTSKIMGFSPSKTSSIIDKILITNRQKKSMVHPKKVLFERSEWHTSNKNILDFYLDFETLNSNFGSIIKDGIISYDNNQFVFMIGIGYSLDNKWIFKNFIMENKSTESELLMFNNFFIYVNKILKDNNKTTAKFYHWSQAEVISFNRFKNKNNIFKQNENNIILYDLFRVFKEEPITIKGALNFSLKTIAKALYKHKLIKSSWDTTSPCSNGLNAMIIANNIYDKTNITDIDEEPAMKDIAKYNEIDCKVMWEIHDLLKNKY
jgi:hypothetical protein